MTNILRDFSEAVILGYDLKPTTAEAIKIIDRHFKGFDILTFVTDLERLLKPFAKEPIAREIELTDPPPVMRIEYISENYLDESEGLYISRTFSYEQGELVVYHEIQQLPYLCRKHGMGKKIMSAFLEQYEKMGVKRIDLYAALSDGGAVWARLGSRQRENQRWSEFCR